MLLLSASCACNFVLFTTLHITRNDFLHLHYFWVLQDHLLRQRWLRIRGDGPNRVLVGHDGHKFAPRRHYHRLLAGENCRSCPWHLANTGMVWVWHEDIAVFRFLTIRVCISRRRQTTMGLFVVAACRCWWYRPSNDLVIRILRRVVGLVQNGTDLLILHVLQHDGQQDVRACNRLSGAHVWGPASSAWSRSWWITCSHVFPQRRPRLEIVGVCTVKVLLVWR